MLVALYLGLGVLHLSTDPHQHQLHDIYFKATYVQIILAGLWFGWRGGLAMSLATSALYLWHIFFQLRGHGAHSVSTLLAELCLYNLVALVTGLLSSRQEAARRALEATSRDLEQSYRSLREKTEELLAAEEALRAADRLRTAGEIAAGVAHELRNPLGGILGAAEILSRPGTAPEARAEFAEVLTREIRRLDGVVSSFLDYARPRAEGGAEVSVDAALDRVFALLEPNLKRQSIRLRRSGTAAPIPGDAEALVQVFLNLALNAAQAMPEGGELRVDIRSDGELVRVRFTDEGRGIPDEVVARVFEPFVTTKPGGTGLGLAISSRIVGGFGGELRLVATGRTGTIFEVSLPCLPGAAPA